MDSLLPSTDWQSLGKVQYEKMHIYEMEWSDGEKYSIDNCKVSCAPFAGPLALWHSKENKVIIVQPNGETFLTIQLKSNQKLVGFDWTEELRLLCIFRDGNAISYSTSGDAEIKFSLLSPKSNDRIAQVVTWSSGLIAFTEKLDFIHVSEIDSPRPRISFMADAKLGSYSYPPSSIAVLEPKFSKQNSPEIYVAMEGGKMLLVTRQDVTDLQIQDSLGKSKAPIISMAIAPNGTFMALYSSDGILTVLNTSFDKKILAFDTKIKGSGSVPTQMIWCGEDAVVMYWKGTGLIIVGPYGSWLRYDYDPNEPIALCQEVDSCRIYTSRVHELLRRVPSSIERIRRLGSTVPGAMLIDALNAFDSGDAKADDNIRSLQADRILNEATQQCIDAAGDEFDHDVQRILLRAASYGRSFAITANPAFPEEEDDEVDIESFVEQCRDIRVLNACRTKKVALPLTRMQYERLTKEVAIGRLVALHHHFFALKICEYLHISTDRVLVHWACEKVKSSSSLSDEKVAMLVRRKLESAQCVSYAEIASCAERAGRRRLATMLLDLEVQPADQIPLLLSMGEFELALVKSIQSSDTNLLYMALLHIEQTLKSIDEFKYVLMCEESYREAIELMVTYYRQSKSPPAKIKALWTDSQGGSTMDSADHAVRVAYRSTSWESHIKELSEAAVQYTQAKAPFHAKATEDQVDLIQEQLLLQDKTGIKLAGLSVSDTIKKFCIDSKKDPKLLQMATHIAKKFKVSDKTFYRVKINALTKTRQWVSLPCYNMGEKRYAQEYASRITATEEKFETFLYMDAWTDALDVAIKQKDPEKLSTIRNQCQVPEIHKLVDQAAMDLGFIS